MNKLQIIGLSGTNGSGKDTVGQVLAKNHRYLFVSVTDLLRAEARRRGLSTERKVLREISAEWRRESGLAVLVDKAVAEYKKNLDRYSGVVMASLRNPGEVDKVHELGGTTIWVDADPRIRYERVQRNANMRARADEDNKTFEEFMAEEAAEMHRSGDEATLDMAGVKAKADMLIENDYDSLEEFEAEIERRLTKNAD